MFESEKNGYNKTEVDYYIKRLESDYQQIIKGHSDRLENVKRNVAELTTDLNEYSQVVPQYKTEIDSLRERLENVRDVTNRCSEQRYLKDADSEVLLANLIAQVLTETADIDKLKPIDAVRPNTAIGQLDGGDFFEVLASNKELKLDEALSGFDFFDNNPFKTKAEKKLARIEAKKAKRARK